VLGRPRRRGAAPRRIVRRLDRRPRSFSPRRRSERPTLPRAAIKQARPDENPPGRSWPSHRRPPCRLMAAQKVAHPPVACRPSPSPCRRFCTNLGLSSVSPSPSPVCGPFNAGGKRRAEPSTTSRRAHGRSKGRPSRAGGKRRAEPSTTSRRAHGRSKGRPSRAGGKRRAEPSTTSRRAHGRSKGRPPRAGGKRRAEPSVTSWRAHGPPKGRTDPWLRRRLRRERRR